MAEPSAAQKFYIGELVRPINGDPTFIIQEIRLRDGRVGYWGNDDWHHANKLERVPKDAKYMPSERRIVARDQATITLPFTHSNYRPETDVEFAARLVREQAQYDLPLSITE